MKVILLQDVAKIGRRGEVKEVNQGYANNFLLPRKLARPASKNDESAAKALQKEREIQKEVKKELLEKTFDDLKNKEIFLKEKSNEKGHLFSQVHKDEIKKALKEQLHVDINDDFIKLNDPIKEIGEFSISLEAQGVSTQIKLVVENA